MLNTQQIKDDLKIHWLIVNIMLVMVASYIAVAHLLPEEIRLQLPVEQRTLIRTILYAIAIIGFPMTNLIRHIQLRLNQTMPGATPAKNRYLQTICVSMALSEIGAVFGLIMFYLGDEYNTLYIFTGMSALAIFLYRPKEEEYLSIIEALSANGEDIAS